MDKHVMIAPVGEKPEAIFIGIRDFPVERLILLVQESGMKVAQKVKHDVEKFKIPVHIEELKGNLWEALFEKITKIKNVEGDHKMIINTASAGRMSQCALTSAAFVNGVKAFSIENGETMLLPILKFSYYKMLTDRKMGILKLLYQQKDCCASLEDLSKRTKMSLPLISYHVNGTPKSEGLKDLGLIETSEDKGRTSVQISTMGRLLLKGYVT